MCAVRLVGVGWLCMLIAMAVVVAMVCLRQTLCPSGRYNINPNGASPSDCAACPGGSYCPVGTTSPLSCPTPAYYCPPASGAPLLVGLGNYSSPSIGPTTQVQL